MLNYVDWDQEMRPELDLEYHKGERLNHVDWEKGMEHVTQEGVEWSQRMQAWPRCRTVARIPPRVASTTTDRLIFTVFRALCRSFRFSATLTKVRAIVLCKGDAEFAFATKFKSITPKFVFVTDDYKYVT